MTDCKTNKIFWFIAIALLLMCSACNDEVFTTEPDKQLTFSTDTLRFDSVFSTVGSATKRFMIYNTHKQSLRISSIELKGGQASPFRLNVDGLRNATNAFSNIEIPANDSLFVFVEVTTRTNNVDAPVLAADWVQFQTNGNTQKVVLEAVAQDVVLFKNKIIRHDTIFTANKPYLIYGDLIIDTLKTLRIEPGALLYFYNNARLVVLGNLRAEGSFDQPIVMRGHRRDFIGFDKPVPYNYVAGQWGGVYLLSNNGQHVITNTQIRSAQVGIYMTNDDRTQLPNLKMRNSVLHNFVFYALVAQNANVDIANSELSNTGSHCVYLSGGTHSFEHCSILNFYNNGTSQPGSRDRGAAMLIQALPRTAPMFTRVVNSVIDGSLDNEFSIASRFPDKQNAEFSNNFIRRTDTIALPMLAGSFWLKQKDSVLYRQSKYDFEKKKYFDFEPDSLSPLRNKALIDIANKYPLDLRGRNRMADSQPDIGAYEWSTRTNVATTKDLN